MINQIIHGDCFEVLRDIPDSFIDSLITDPPAGISFMGKDWDRNKGGILQWINWFSEVMAECLRVMKPGACGLVWSIPRTSHWTGMALELAGFKIIDIVHHCNGMGFPKGQDIGKLIDQMAGEEREVVGMSQWYGRNPNGRKLKDEKNAKYGVDERTDEQCNILTAPATPEAKQWDGWKTPALKPSVENWWLVQKPISESSIARNILKHGVGGLNIEACRIGTSKRVPGSLSTTPNNVLGKGMGSYKQTGEEDGHNPNIGRYPANLLLSCGANCKGDEHSPDCPVSVIGGQSGICKSGGSGKIIGYGKGIFRNKSNPSPLSREISDTGTAARYFKQLPFDPETVPSIYYQSKASSSDRSSSGTVKNTHPTVKSRHLMKYLITLITPNNGIVLDPFCGSGTTAIACKELNRNYICIEKEKEYFDIACKRVNQPRETVENDTILENFNQENIPEFKQLSLF